MEHKIIALAQEIIDREPGRRPEADWIQKRVERFAEAEGIKSRAETDSLIFEKMYARAPKKTETTKIRYWRTGHHLPASREEGLRFAEVLRLDETERLYFLQAYMEKSDVVYEKVPEEDENLRKEYEKRTALMETMISEYIEAVPAHRMIQLDIPYENLAAHARHLYCMDALKATALAKNLPEKNWGLIFGTNNYEAEFQRIRRLSGEIPRRMVLRQILLMGIPYLNRAIMDERLTGLGYLPLTEGHTSPKGALLDDLIIGFFQLYEETCMGKDPLACRNWALEQFQRLDTYFLDCKKEEYRILYFRILSTMLGYGESK